MAFGNTLKKPKVLKYDKAHVIVLTEDVVESILQSYLQSISWLNDNEDIIEIEKIHEPKKMQGIKKRVFHIKTKEIKSRKT